MNDFRKRFEKKTRNLFNKDTFRSNKNKFLGDIFKTKKNKTESSEKTKKVIKTNVEALGKTWNIFFKKGIPYLNYFNIFYALPKKITIYLMVLGFMIFIGCGIPLSYDFLLENISWYTPLPFNVLIGIAWTSISGLLLLQAATTGYAYLSKESLVKARIERTGKVMRYRFYAFLLITINVLFTIVTLLSIPYDFSSHALSWTSLFVSLSLALLTTWVYKYQKSLLQRQAFVELQEKTRKHLPESQEEITLEQKLSPFLYLDQKSVLKNQEYVKELDKILKRKEKKTAKSITKDLEVSWLEKTRIWNWKIVKNLSTKARKFDFLTKWFISFKNKLRKIRSKFKK